MCRRCHPSHNTSLKRGGCFTSTGGTLSSMLTDIGTVVTQALTWVGQVATTITGNPLLLLFVVVAFVGLGVGLMKRIIRL